MYRNRIVRGFTLIELLIVVAIILILIAIALPNFLEAQIRARVTKARAELKSLVTATESYKIDWGGREPKTEFEPINNPPFGYSEWWGFTSHLLTTPVAHITDFPTDPFADDYTLAFWTGNLRGNPAEFPYTVIRTTWGCHAWTVGATISNNPQIVQRLGGTAPVPRQFVDGCKHSGYIYYSSGPDLIDSTVWLAPAFYTPTNGTQSFGDLYEFGPGGPDPREIRE